MEEVKVVKKPPELNKTIRNYSLDILKILAICFVCSYHFSLNNVVFGPVDSFTFSSFINTLFFVVNAICIPLFFMVNGALLLNKSVNIKKHVKKCIIMVFVFILWRFVTILSISLYNGTNLSNIGILYWIEGVLMFGSFPGVDLAHFWFIPMLISLYIIYPLFSHLFLSDDKSAKHYLFLFISILFIFMFVGGDLVIAQRCLLGNTYTNFSGILNFAPFGLARCGYLFYFLIGGIFFKYKEKFKRVKWYYLCPLFLVGLFWLFGYWFLQNTFWDYIFGGYNLLPTVLMSSSLFLLTLKIPNEKIDKCKFLKHTIKTIGSNTLTIYYTHWIVGYTLLQAIKPYIVQYGLITNCIKVLFFIVIGSILGVVMKRIPIIKNLVS